MQKNIRLWQLAGFIFSSILGVILHFLFDWSGQSISVAPFSAVNESIWEHLKLLFFPMLIFAFIESRYISKSHPNFWCTKLIGISLGVILTPVLYYVTNGAFGPMPDWVNIMIFFVSVASGYALETRLFFQGKPNCNHPKAAIFALLVVAALFVLFTFLPPEIPLFLDPLNGGYGI